MLVANDVIDFVVLALPLLLSLLAMCTVTFPILMPLKMEMASEWDSPAVEWPFTLRISSPMEKIYNKNCVLFVGVLRAMKKKIKSEFRGFFTSTDSDLFCIRLQ